MKNRYFTIVGAALALAVAGSFPSTSRAEEPDIGCKMIFNLTGWSVIYKHAEGNGHVTCNNGKSMDVKIEAVGAGLTVGKSKVDGGHATFSHVYHTSEILGSYAEAEAHAGAVKSGTAQVLTKGNVSLALAGSGEGVDLGIDVGKFTITAAN